MINILKTNSFLQNVLRDISQAEAQMRISQKIYHLSIKKVLFSLDWSGLGQICNVLLEHQKQCSLLPPDMCFIFVFLEEFSPKNIFISFIMVHFSFAGLIQKIPVDRLSDMFAFKLTLCLNDNRVFNLNWHLLTVGPLQSFVYNDHRNCHHCQCLSLIQFATVSNLPLTEELYLISNKTGMWRPI